MEELLIRNVFLVIVSMYFFNKTKNALHMLQLESYKNKRYFKWIKKNFRKTIQIKDIIVLAILIGVVLTKTISTGLIVVSLIYLAFVAFLKPQPAKKPFVETNRIKRMYTTYGVIFAIMFVLLNTNSNKEIIEIVSAVLPIFAYYIVFVVNIVNAPIEKHIQHGFYKKAKKKLNNMPNLPVVGITGSYGKTSTKYILTTILNQKYNALMTPGSFNTTMGVVRTLNEYMKSTHNLFVCEMGAKQIGDIKEICDLVKPKYGILTAIGPQHLETFKSIDNVRKTKLELIDSLPDDGIAFVNMEDENIRNSNITKNKITYGLNDKCDYYADKIELNERGSSFTIHMKNGESLNVKTKLLGKHNIINIMGAVAVADTLGLSKEEIYAGIYYLKPVPHRLELKSHPNGKIIIDDAYNSNSQGAKMALEVLKGYKNKTRVLVTPGIVDLGAESEKYNMELGKEAAEAADFIILVGEKQAEPIKKGILEKKYDEKKLYIAKDLNDAIAKMNQVAKDNSVVLLENDLPDNYL